MASGPYDTHSEKKNKLKTGPFKNAMYCVYIVVYTVVDESI